MNANEMNRTLAGLKNDPNYTHGLGDIYSIVRNASLGPLGVWLFGEMQPDQTITPGQIDKVTPAIGQGVASGLSNGITLAIVGAAAYFLILRK